MAKKQKFLHENVLQRKQVFNNQEIFVMKFHQDQLKAFFYDTI